MALLKNGLIGLGFIALLLFVVRPLLKVLKSARPAAFEPLSDMDEDPAQLEGVQRAQLAMQAINQRELTDYVKKDLLRAP